jgi:hypothetical protein
LSPFGYPPAILHAWEARRDLPKRGFKKKKKKLTDWWKRQAIKIRHDQESAKRQAKAAKLRAARSQAAAVR